MMLSRGRKSQSPAPAEAVEKTPEGASPAKAPAAAAKAPPAEEEKTTFGGWVRVDSDNVLRGWATDRANRDLRPTVDITIDDEPIAALKADRFDPKLAELGEHDGRYAFAMVIPEKFRDGEPHSFAATVRGSAFKLKSKLDTLRIESDAWLPWIEVYRAGYGVAEGRLHNGQYSKSTNLELWRGNERLPVEVETHWSGPVGDMGFTVTFPGDAAGEGEPELVLAAPGMIEAGLEGAPLAFSGHVEAACDERGHLDVRLAGDTWWLEGHALELRVYTGGDSAAFSQPFVFDGGPLHVSLPPELVQAVIQVRIAVDGREFPQLATQASRLLGKLTANGSFEHWAGDGPADWTAETSSGTVTRGFYAFPHEIADQQGATGDILHFSLPEGEPGRVLLRQPLTLAFAEGEGVEAALLARCSKPANLTIRVVNDAGEEAGAVSIGARRAWAWTYGAKPMVFAAKTATMIEIAIDTAESVEVDLAGVRLGGEAFRDAPAPEEAFAPSGANAVVNADLEEWPYGVGVRALTGRAEAARGWFVINRRAQDPISVKALLPDEESDRVGLMLSAEKVPDYCRLEVRLDTELMSQLKAGLLSFEIGSPLAARRLLSASTVAAPEFQLIDRILILKRSQVASDKGFNIVDETVATPGRKLVITRRFHRYEIPLAIGSSKKASEFEWEDGETEVTSEYYLVFEFRQAFAVAFRDMRLTADREGQPEPASTYLQLEDRSIAIQAEHTRGLGLWLSPETVDPLALAAGQPVKAPTARWSWSAQRAGTVEVVICVYNAVEETLACLRSLIGTTQVPHTVRIVDDGSEPYVRRRIEDFIADKPWMQLTPNPENMGYTYSADRGIRESEADWVVLLNSDTVVTPGWLEGLLEAVASDPHAAFSGPLSNAATFQSVPELYDSKNQFKTNDLPPGWSPADVASVLAQYSERDFPEAPLLNGFCTLMRRSVFLEVGGLNRGAFPAGYGEENDLCTRVVKAGYKLLIADHVYVYHSKSASFGSARKTELSKAGSKALKELHPDVDYGAATARFRDIPTLVRLRAAMREHLKS